ncbi:MAG: hypothetical protein B0W54_12145 [Cellvibrio sp. 79]|nr:MAG: hypothetical protein B0W54_12145 [Cellvibrio sp. 79]
MIKILVTAIVSFGAGAALTYSIVSGDTPDAIALPMAVESHAQSSVHSTNVHADYIRQLEELNRKLTKDLQAARGGQATKDSKDAQKPEQQTMDAVNFEQYYQARKNSEEFNQYLQSVATGNGYVKDMASKFEAETVDGQWATDYESRLYNLFESDALAGKVVPQSVVCKSRRCQIKVAVADIDQANQTMESFSKALNDNQLAIDKSMVVSAPDLTEGVVSLYVARDGNVKIHE